jgi:hypothetical protein
MIAGRDVRLFVDVVGRGYPLVLMHGSWGQTDRSRTARHADRVGGDQPFSDRGVERRAQRGPDLVDGGRRHGAPLPVRQRVSR